VTLTGVAIQEVRDELDLLALDRALEDLAELDPRAAMVVELRFFGGLTMEEIAGQLGVTRRTIQNDWQFASLWLRRELEGADRS
jgi:RNA polymerase sigma factor (sigma-70 family)